MIYVFIIGKTKQLAGVLVHRYLGVGRSTKIEIVSRHK
jgi:predicted protein tyrosine phosphatase